MERVMIYKSSKERTSRPGGSGGDDHATTTPRQLLMHPCERAEVLERRPATTDPRVEGFAVLHQVGQLHRCQDRSDVTAIRSHPQLLPMPGHPTVLAAQYAAEA